jgi:DNA topoisomerase-1
MAENLVIVESPTKARTIGKMLGKDYTIMASVGHVRDLPTHSLGVDLKSNFAPQYVESERSKKVIKDLRSAAKKAKAVYLAPDPDREGEAIAWHLQELLKKQYKGNFERVTFHEITKSAVSKAFENATVVDMNLVDAQQARRVLDRIVGYMVSPLLWSQITRGTSAGRVQTVALRLIVEREREIGAFKPEEYWNFSLKLEAEGETFVAKLFKINADKFKIDNEKDAIALLEAVCNGDGFKVASIEAKDRRRNAPPPFTTSTLQQASSNLLHYSASNTMRIAQQLYEGVETGSGSTGLITYMRTDSVNVAQEARDACKEFIKASYGDKYVPAKPNFFKSKSGAQEAHEAIRPTDVNNTPEKMKAYLDERQLKLYTLIWKRFVASQMARALQRQTAVDVATVGADGKEYTFRANALVTVFPGFMSLYGNAGGEDVNYEVLGKLREQQSCKMIDSLKEQKFTEPPPRYNEASLIKKLEECGIGRPSTYATILRTIQTRNYVDKEKGKLFPTDLGFKVNDFLINVLPSLFEVDFTSRMETLLDEIESGKLVWTDMLDKFYESFEVWLKEAKAFGAPEHEKAIAVINQLDSLEKWEAPVKVGRRTYDDNKFFNSVKDKYAETKVLTAKQWGVLLRLCAKYSSQLPGFNEIAEKYDFVEDWQAALSKHNEILEKQANAPSENEVAKFKKMLSCFDNVKFEEPVKRGKRTYDDKKFIGSFANQVESGKALSEKQLAVLGRFAAKYKDQISDFEELCKLIGIDPEKPEVQMKDGKPVEQDPEVVKLLQDLEKVTEWAEPVKKGKRVFDDKEFVESIRSQVANGRILSPRQVGALKRTAKKYLA